MIRGTDHPWYRNFISEYAKQVPEYVVRPSRYRRPRHLRTWKDAVWVVRTEDSLGTAFELDGIGLVTCAHMVADIDSPWVNEYANPHIHSHQDPSVTYPIKIIDLDPQLDIAVLEADVTSGCPMTPLFSPASSVGDRVKAAGYPRFSRGGGLWEDAGRVTDVRTWMGKPHYLVSITIVSGASGAPVMSEAGGVIGVASRGADEFVDASNRSAGAVSASEDRGYGVVPIAEVRDFVQRSTKISPESK